MSTWRLTPRRYAVSIAALAAIAGAAAVAALEMGPLAVGLLRGDPATALAVRGPRVLVGALVGAGLASAGVAFQALLRNPLADPFILGVSGGAAVGAVAGMMLRAGAIPLFAFLGAAGATFLVWALARKVGGESDRLLLTGVVVNAFLSAMILLLSYLAPPDARLRILQWMTGNLSTSAPTVALAAAVAVPVALFLAMARDLDLISLGERTAADLGVDVGRTRTILFFAGSLVTGAAVASSGLIGFVGLVVPHALRLAVGPDHRLLVPAAVFGGAAFLALADGAARAILPPEDLPVGVLTALSGGPFFLYLLFRGARVRPAAAATGVAVEGVPPLEEPPCGPLVARGAGYDYGVEAIDLEVRPGELLALFGPNGAGKTTLMRLLSGDLRPARGAVEVGGRPLAARPRREAARLIATVPQEPIAAGAYTVGEIVLMGRAPRVGRFRLESEADARAAEAALAAVGMSALRDRAVGEISGGERQRVAIARALAQGAPILLLDEPTAFLDVRHQVEVFRLLRALAKEGGRAVVVASHEVNLAAKVADRAALVEGGRVRAIGAPADVLREAYLVFGEGA